jgi:hypothetical protein
MEGWAMASGRFVCPECGARALTIGQRIELGSDFRSDEVCLQVVRCGKCKFAGMAIYEESRRGRLDDESWSHIGYKVGPDALKRLRAAIRECPKPKDARCSCAAHKRLRRTGHYDGWSTLLPDDTTQLVFPMDRA